MQPVPGNSEQSYVLICWPRRGGVEQLVKKNKHQDQLDQKPEERRNMKPESVAETMAEVVIDRQLSHQDRPPGLIGRQGTACPGVLEKEGDIVQVTNVNIGDDRMRIVKVKAVVEMVRVGDANRHQRKGSEDKKWFLAH